MDTNKYWFALTTKPQHEFKAGVDLTNLEVEYFLPTLTKVRQWRDRKKKITEPIFKGYIFIHANEKERLTALQSKAIIRTVTFSGIPAKIQDFEIENIKRIVSGNPDLLVTDLIKIGQHVLISEGPFAGVQGVVYLNDQKQRMLSVSIELLRRSVLVHLPVESVTTEIKL